MPSRRDVLHSLLTTSALGLSGCVGDSPSDTPAATDSATSTATDSTTPTSDRTRRVPIGETVTIDGTSVTVGNPRVRKSISTLGVHGPTFETFGGQFVVTDVSGGDPGRIGGTFRASVDGEAAPISGPRGDVDPLPIADTERTYAFPFPVRSVETAAIRWARDEHTIYWDLPAEIRDALAAEPAFRVAEFRLPRRDGELVLDVTVENEGDRDGLFWMQASFDAFSGHEIVQFPVPAGESRDYTGRANGLVLQFENNGGGTFEIRYPSEDGIDVLERTVPFSETPTTS